MLRCSCCFEYEDNPKGDGRTESIVDNSLSDQSQQRSEADVVSRSIDPLLTNVTFSSGLLQAVGPWSPARPPRHCEGQVLLQEGRGQDQEGRWCVLAERLS